MGFCDQMNGKQKPGPCSSTAHGCILVNAFQSPWSMVNSDQRLSPFLITASTDLRNICGERAQGTFENCCACQFEKVYLLCLADMQNLGLR